MTASPRISYDHPFDIAVHHQRLRYPSLNCTTNIPPNVFISVKGDSDTISFSAQK